MMRSDICWLLAVISLLLGQVSTQDGTKYVEIDGSLVLKPKPVSESITIITWKCNGDVVAEWLKDKIPLEYLGRFKGHASLELDTGELTLSNVKTVHAGGYSVEINSKIQPDTYQVAVLKALPNPNISVQPLACTKDKDKCSLVCEGNVTASGPVSYFWKEDDGAWNKGEKIKEIINEITQKIKTFSCKLENPVSSRESDPFSNPFYIPDDNKVGTVVGVIIGVLGALGVVGAGAFFYIKRKKQNRNSNNATQDKGNGESNALNETNP